MLPSHYDANIPRVSEIVEWKFPFGGKSLERFVDWLWRKDIEYDDYMAEASSGGTYVHKAMETYGKTGRFRGKLYGNVINAGIAWWKESGAKLIESEKYVRYRSRWQGTCDAIVDIGGTKWLIDFKTYGLAKDKWGIDRGKWKRPTEKLKKATLQLSLYSKATGIDDIAVVELTNEGYKWHALQRMEDKELMKIVRQWEKRWVDEM